MFLLVNSLALLQKSKILWILIILNFSESKFCLLNDYEGIKTLMVKTISFSKNLWTQFSPLITSINQMEAEIQGLSEARLKEKTKSLKSAHLNGGSQVDTKTLVESFALVREASRRTLGLRHYDTQLLGGLVLNDNQIAEMRTGEGKTLVATAPAY